MTDYFTADLHLSDPTIAAARGFTDIRTHDQTILDRLADTLDNYDRLFILGNLTTNPAKNETNAEDPDWMYALNRLSGMAKEHNWTIYTILGPDDPAHPVHLNTSRRYYGNYQSFSHYVATTSAIRLADTTVMINALPYSGAGVHVDDDLVAFRTPDTGAPLIHGGSASHTPRPPLVPGRPRITASATGSIQVNVSLDVTGMTPVRKQTIHSALRTAL